MAVPAPGLILVTSHRGNWESCPENTLESFQTAWDQGAEGAEMDVRLSAPGYDNGGVYYGKGEVFLSHDYDIRGEAPQLSNQSTNYIYSLTPDQLRARQMADRRGNLLVDSNSNPVRMHSFTDLLNSYYERAKTVGFVPGSGGSPIGDYDLMNVGMLLTIDVKSSYAPVPPSGTNYVGASQLETLLECLAELNTFQNRKHVDLRNAIAFKLGWNEFVYGRAKSPTKSGAGRASDFINLVQSVDGWKTQQGLPKLIFILFPFDAVSCTQDGITVRPPDRCDCSASNTVCTQIQPSNFTMLNEYNQYYSDSPNITYSLLVNDMQHRSPNDALAPYFNLNDPVWGTRGRASFLASNNFAEGVRNSGADCKNTFGSAGDKINLSFCVSDPVQRWASSTLDFLVQPPPPTGSGTRTGSATSITTDQYSNAIRYLNAIGQNNTALIQ